MIKLGLRIVLSAPTCVVMLFWSSISSIHKKRVNKQLTDVVLALDAIEYHRAADIPKEYSIFCIYYNCMY